MANNVKLRIFIKTYLFLKGEATSEELANAYNECKLEGNTVTTREVGGLLGKEAFPSTTSILRDLKSRKRKDNRKVWYL